MEKRYSVLPGDSNPQSSDHKCLRCVCHFTISNIRSEKHAASVAKVRRHRWTDRLMFQVSMNKKLLLRYISAAVSIQRGYEVAAFALWPLIQQFKWLQQDWISFTGKFWALQQWNKRNNCVQIPCYNPRLCELYLITPTGHRLRREDRRQLIWSKHLRGLQASLPVSSLNHIFLWISFLKIQKTCI